MANFGKEGNSATGLKEVFMSNIDEMSWQFSQNAQNLTENSITFAD